MVGLTLAQNIEKNKITNVFFTISIFVLLFDTFYKERDKNIYTWI